MTFYFRFASNSWSPWVVALAAVCTLCPLCTSSLDRLGLHSPLFLPCCRYLFHLPSLKKNLVNNQDIRPKLRIKDGLLFIRYEISDLTSMEGASLAVVQVRWVWEHVGTVWDVGIGAPVQGQALDQTGTRVGIFPRQLPSEKQTGSLLCPPEGGNNHGLETKPMVAVLH